MKSALLFLLSLFFGGCQGQDTKEMDKAVSKSLKKADSYFQSVGLGIEAGDVVMLLFILQEHFKYNLNLPPLEEFKKKYPDLANSYFMIYESYFDGRSIPDIDSNSAMNYLAANINSLDGVTAWSIFCNKFPLPDTMINVLNNNVERGGYSLTHTALHLGNMLRLKCLKPDESIETLKKKLVGKMVELIHSSAISDASDDMKYEAIAMLYYLGEGNLVTPENIQWVIDSQMDDGGWKTSVIKEKSHPHAAVLALWVLLEYNSQHKK